MRTKLDLRALIALTLLSSLAACGTGTSDGDDGDADADTDTDTDVDTDADTDSDTDTDTGTGTGTGTGTASESDTDTNDSCVDYCQAEAECYGYYYKEDVQDCVERCECSSESLFAPEFSTPYWECIANCDDQEDCARGSLEDIEPSEAATANLEACQNDFPDCKDPAECDLIAAFNDDVQTDLASCLADSGDCESLFECFGAAVESKCPAF